MIRYMVSTEMALSNSASSSARFNHSDADRLLDGYRAARAQKVLFDLHSAGTAGPGIGYDEFVDDSGYVRPSWTELADAIGGRGRAGLHQLRSVMHRLIYNDGITYTGIDPGALTNDHGVVPGLWRLD